MFFYLLLAFVLVPIVEIWLLIRIGQAIDVGPTIGLILLTGVIGAALARHEGMRTVRRIQDTLGQGRIPALAMIEGVLIFVAGVVLVTPGVITDACGFLLLVPPVRSWIARRLAAHFRGRIVVGGMGFPVVGDTGTPAPTRDDIIDVEFRDVTDERDERRMTSDE